MPEIKFSNDKADRWIERLQKRRDRLTQEELLVLDTIRDLRFRNIKLDPQSERALFSLGKKV